MSSTVHDVLGALRDALDGFGDGWYLFGAQAALLRGSRRLTSDIDVTVLPGPSSTEDLVERLRTHAFRLRVPDVDDFVQQTRVLPVVHEPTGMPVDVVLGGPGLEELFLSDAELVTLGTTVVPVPTAEHLIVMKLLAGRPLDLDDAEAMFRAAKPAIEPIESLVDAIAEGLGEDDVRVALSRLRQRVNEAADCD